MATSSRSSLARRVLTSSTTPWILFGSSMFFAVVAGILPFLASDQTVEDLFRSAVLAGLAETLVAIYAVIAWLEKTKHEKQTQVEIVSPPGSINDELLNLINDTQVGQLTMICYGSNRFGKVLDTVSERLPQMRTSVLVCQPERALNPNDGSAIDDFVSDMANVSHVEVQTTSLIPTLRAAVLRDKRGVPIWASVSLYLMYNQFRALRSEGRSPIFKVDDPRSPAMPVLVEFILSEFERLTKEQPIILSDSSPV